MLTRPQVLVSQIWNAIIISMYREHLLSIEHVQKLLYHQVDTGEAGKRSLRAPPFFVAQGSSGGSGVFFPPGSEAERRMGCPRPRRPGPTTTGPRPDAHPGPARPSPEPSPCHCRCQPAPAPGSPAAPTAGSAAGSPRAPPAACCGASSGAPFPPFPPWRGSQVCACRTEGAAGRSTIAAPWR